MITEGASEYEPIKISTRHLPGRKRSFLVTEFSKRLIVGCDASNWSKIERGIHSPPQSKNVLDEIASALKIRYSSGQSWANSLSSTCSLLLSAIGRLSKLPSLYDSIEKEGIKVQYQHM
jgi:transcriptional regulator with XRE-family HTH domain